MLCLTLYIPFFFFNDTATTEIYTLSLHDALPIWQVRDTFQPHGRGGYEFCVRWQFAPGARLEEVADRRFRVSRNGDRKSTRLNSSHGYISYAVFCLKKKKDREQIRE